MQKNPTSSGSVLIIEPDQPIRLLMTGVLRRAGFAVRSVADLDAAAAVLRETETDAVVRDLNLTPAIRSRSLQQLAATGAELLRRTIITTTATDYELHLAGYTKPFAVVCKPFEIIDIVRAVGACVVRDRTTAPPVANIAALQQFVTNLPHLRRLMAGPAPTSRELLLRSEMRRTLAELSEALSEAAQAEPSRLRAAALLAASSVAAELVARPVGAAPLRRGH